MRDLPGHRGGDIDDAGIGDGGGDTVLEGHRPGYPIPGLNDAEQRDLPGIDFRPRQQVVHNRGAARRAAAAEK